MGSVGFGEIALIAIVALLVFGPDRLPELSRKAGELLTKAREATRSFTDSLDSEFEDATSPIRTLQTEFQATKDELTSAAGTLLDFNGQSSSSENPSETDDASATSDDPPPPETDDQAPE
jgi:Tat protein translocase TatB subunit